MLQPRSLLFVFFLSGLSALAPLSTDMALSAYGPTAAALGTDEAHIALSLTLFVAGYALGPLVYGPVSDRFGRRPVLLAGLIGYVATSLFCLFAQSVPVLLVGRLVQGAAASSGSVMAMAITRDLFEGAAAQRKMSLVMGIQTLMPMMAPTLGAVVLAWGGWRAIYGVMVVGGVALLVASRFLGETNHQLNRQALRSSILVGSYAQVLGHPVVGRYIVLGGLAFAVLFSYITGSPILFVKDLGVSPQTYGIIFAIPTVGAIVGTTLNGVLAGRSGYQDAIVGGGLLLMLAAGISLMVLTWSNSDAIVLMVAILACNGLGFGLILPVIAHRALERLPHMIGFVTAAQSFVLMASGAVAGSICAGLAGYIGGRAMAIIMVGFGIAAVALFGSMILRRNQATADVA